MASCSDATPHDRRGRAWRLAAAIAAALLAVTTLQGCPNDCGGAGIAIHRITIDVLGLEPDERFTVTSPQVRGGREIVCPSDDFEVAYRCLGPDGVEFSFETNPGEVDITIVSQSAQAGTATVETRAVDDKCPASADLNHYEVTVVLE